MADTLTTQSATLATVPAASVIATDDAGAAGHVQVVKLAISADGSATAIPADAINGIDVDVTRVTGTVVVDGSAVTQPVSAASLPLPTGAATSANQTTEITSLQLIDDAVHTDDAVRSKSLLIGAVLDDTAPTAITENQAGYLRMSSRRALLVEGVASGTVIPVSDGGGNLSVDWAGTVPPIGAGTEAAALRVTVATDSTGVLAVKQATASNLNATVVGTGTFAVQAALTAGTNTNEVVGDVAHDIPITGNPLTVGGVASAAAPTDVSADQDAVRAWFLRNGAQATVVTAAGALIGGDAPNGLDVDVTRLPALVAGTANIGDVDVLTVPAPLSTTGNGTAATALRVSVASDSTGSLAVTQATASSLKAQVQGEAASGAAKAGNPVQTGGVFNTTPPTVTTGQAVEAQYTARGEAHGVIRDAAGNLRGANVDASNRLTVDAASWIGSTAPTVGSKTSANSVPVVIASDQGAVAVTAAQSTAASLKNEPAGNVAHDAVDSGNPIKIGAKVETSPKGITLPVDGDRTDLYADADGMLMVKIGAAYGDLISERITNTDGASTAFTNFSAVASTRNYVTAICALNTSAAAAYVDFRDGTAGAILWTLYLPAGGGSNIACSIPLFKTSANTALAYDVNTPTTTVAISISGFQSKV